METILLQSDILEDLQYAAQLLQNGEAVAFPTDTVYGLGATAHNDSAVKKIYTAKGRPPEKPLILLIHNQQQLYAFTDVISDTAQKLMDAFWPGPLTLIFPLRDGTITNAVTRGLSTIGVRIPNHAIALQLLQMVNMPIAAPSANLSGNPSTTTAEQVMKELGGRIAAIVSDESNSIGKASTIVDISGDIPLILREGAISDRELSQVLGYPIKKAVNA